MSSLQPAIDLAVLVPWQIDSDELYDYLRYLGLKCRRVDVDNMIWEVDENNDGCVDWEEFKTMHAAAPLAQCSMRATHA